MRRNRLLSKPEQVVYAYESRSRKIELIALCGLLKRVAIIGWCEGLQIFRSYHESLKNCFGHNMIIKLVILGAEHGHLLIIKEVKNFWRMEFLPCLQIASTAAYWGHLQIMTWARMRFIKHHRKMALQNFLAETLITQEMPSKFKSFQEAYISGITHGFTTGFDRGQKHGYDKGYSDGEHQRYGASVNLSLQDILISAAQGKQLRAALLVLLWDSAETIDLREIEEVCINHVNFQLIDLVCRKKNRKPYFLHTASIKSWSQERHPVGSKARCGPRHHTAGKEKSASMASPTR